MEAGGINLPGAKDLVFIKSLSTAEGGKISLKPGDLIQARVVAFSKGSTILNIGGTRIPASTNLDLNPGDMISLMVLELGSNKVVFKQLSDTGRSRVTAKYTKDTLIEHLLRNAGLKGADLENAVDILKGFRIDTGRDLAHLEKIITGFLARENGDDAAFNRLSTKLSELVVKSSGSKEIAVNIKAMVEALSHEANLISYLEKGSANLESFKMSLLQAQSALQNSLALATNEAMSSLKASIAKVLDLLNAVEILNLPVDSQPERFIYLPLPVKVGQEVRTAEIKIYARGPGSKEKQGKNSSFTVAFAMEMPSLGKTRAVLEAVDKYINFALSVKGREALVEAKSQLDELKRSFEDLGYEVGRMAVTEIHEEEQRSLIEEKLGVKLEGIDFKA